MLPSKKRVPAQKMVSESHKVIQPLRDLSRVTKNKCTVLPSTQTLSKLFLVLPIILWWCGTLNQQCAPIGSWDILTMSTMWRLLLLETSLPRAQEIEQSDCGTTQLRATLKSSKLILELLDLFASPQMASFFFLVQTICSSKSQMWAIESSSSLFKPIKTGSDPVNFLQTPDWLHLALMTEQWNFGTLPLDNRSMHSAIMNKVSML